jgi:DNA-binding NarL/FixJ family response regulator
MPIRVLIVDDHAFVRMSLTELLGQFDDIVVVGSCADGTEVAEAATSLQPHVVLMDVKMPKMSGLEAARVLLADQPHIRVVVLTGTFDPSYATEVQALGAAGLLLKGEGTDALPDQIRAVVAGETVWSRSVAV